MKRIRKTEFTTRLPKGQIVWEDKFNHSTSVREITCDFAEGIINGKEWVKQLGYRNSREAAKKLINAFGVRKSRSLAKRWMRSYGYEFILVGNREHATSERYYVGIAR